MILYIAQAEGTPPPCQKCSSQIIYIVLSNIQHAHRCPQEILHSRVALPSYQATVLLGYRIYSQWSAQSCILRMFLKPANCLTAGTESGVSSTTMLLWYCVWAYLTHNAMKGIKSSLLCESTGPQPNFLVLVFNKNGLNPVVHLHKRHDFSK